MAEIISSSRDAFSPFEILFDKFYQNYKVPFISSVLAGLASYMYVFTNKLVQYDELYYTFGKGEGLTSGRWGLDILSHIFPNFSMPWFNGVITIILVAISVCLIVAIFEIKSKLLQCMLACAIETNVALASNMLLLYVSTCYTLSLLFSVISVYFFTKGQKKSLIVAFLFSILAISIYQAYLSVISSLLLIAIIKDTMDSEVSCSVIIKKGFLYVSFIAFSSIVYYVITIFLLKANNLSFNAYASSGSTGFLAIIENIKFAYVTFINIFLHHYDSLIGTDVSQFAHLICIIIAGISYIRVLIAQNNTLKTLFSIFLIIIFLPLSINLIFITAGISGAKHALMMCGFCTIYVLLVVVIDGCPLRLMYFSSNDVITICFSIICISNSFVANKSFMKQQMDYENIYAFFTISMSQVSSTPGFDADSKVAFVGWYNMPEYVHNFGTNLLYGSQELGNAYSRDLFIKYYIGLDIDLAEYDEIMSIEADPRYLDMPRYPYYGYVNKIDNYIVVKY